jgi:hypothetical protein
MSTKFSSKIIQLRGIVKRYIRQGRLSLLIIFTLIAVMILLLVGKNKYGTPFAMDFLANWLATLLGVAIGIPVILLTNQYLEKSSERDRKRKILTLLKDELGRNYSELTLWCGETAKDKKKETAKIPAFLRVECWKAFSEGGEIEWIKDPDLMYIIAEAYYWIRAVMYLSEKHSTLLINSYMSEEISSYTVNKLYSSLISTIENAVLVVESAESDINRHLAEINLKS